MVPHHVVVFILSFCCFFPLVLFFLFLDLFFFLRILSTLVNRSTVSASSANYGAVEDPDGGAEGRRTRRRRSRGAAVLTPPTPSR